MRKNVSLLFALVAWLLAAGGAEAQRTERARRGLSESALCGLVTTAFPTCAEGVTLSATAGYGYTESIGPVPGAHHRLRGALAVGVVPLRWLSLALRLDGRLDLHPEDTLGRDRTGTGEPRLILRAGHALTPRVSLGGETVVWFPGGNAPSLEPRATTIDLKALAAWEARPVAVLGHFGVRIDQSDRSAPDVVRLRPGDRTALGLSAYHAVLLAVGLGARTSASSELFAELSLDWLVGTDAPPFRQSPLRLAFGARAFFGRGLQGELAATAVLSDRPAIDVLSPLVPIEPRFGVSMGLRYAKLRAAEAPPPVPRPPVALEVPPTAPEPTTARVSGTLTDAQGAPLPDVRVELRGPGEPREAIADGEGRYAFEDVPVGPVTLVARAPGFAPEQWEVTVAPRMEPLPARAMTPQANVGSLRVLTRTFRSEPLAAKVLVRDAAGRKVASGTAAADGRYEIDLPPGRYSVTISAPGHRPHRRDVQIERYGVAILNVDLREGR